jgi:hypothetical protein
MVATPYSPEGVTMPVAPSGVFTSWWRRRSDRVVEHEMRESLRWSFRQACIGSGVCLAVDAPVAGTSYRTPAVTNIVLGSPLRMTVRMLEGQVPAQLGRAGYLIAPHLGGVALRVQDRGFGWAIVDVLTVDPLAAVLPLEREGESPSVLLGRDEGGQDVTVDPVDLPHMIVQGQTRSGKSTFLYALLAQLTRHDHVIVAGVDPSGITLRPFTGTRHEPWQALGLASLDGIEKVLAELVAEMDHRLAAMPLGRDILPVGADNPLIVAVLDEYPALLRAVDAADTKAGKRVRALVARLLAESHKVGFRVVLAAQRAEASIVGAAERAQCAGRLSFRVDSADSIKLLHPDADDYAAGHTSSPPGIALLSWPGRPLSRVRAPYIDYAGFCAAVAGAA